MSAPLSPNAKRIAMQRKRRAFRSRRTMLAAHVRKYGFELPAWAEGLLPASSSYPASTLYDFAHTYERNAPLSQIEE